MSFSERSSTEKNDLKIFDAGMKLMLDFGEDDSMPHFIYCGDYYSNNNNTIDDEEEIFVEMFSEKMEEHGLQSAVLTIFGILRKNLITKEKTKMAYEEKLKNDKDWFWEDYEGSMNDD